MTDPSSDVPFGGGEVGALFSLDFESSEKQSIFDRKFTIKVHEKIDFPPPGNQKNCLPLKKLK